MLSKQQRIESVAPKLRVLVQQHEDGTYHGGVEAFNALIMGVIKQAGLLTEETKKPQSCRSTPRQQRDINAGSN